jgi:hypothetical protein
MAAANSPNARRARCCWTKAVCGSARYGAVSGLCHKTRAKTLIANAANATPRRFDWRNGYNLLDTQQLFKLRDGRIGAFNLGGNGAQDSCRYTAIAAHPENGCIPTFHLILNIVRDKRGHIWRIPSLPSRSLQEWDGQALDFATPSRAEIVMSHLADTFHRLARSCMLMPDFSRMTKRLFLTYRDGHGRVFPSLPNALQNQLIGRWAGAAWRH